MMFEDMDEADNADIDRAAGALAAMVSAPEAEQVLAKALANPKLLAMFLAQAIERTQMESMKRELPINPKVWLAPGGAIDDIADELSEVAEIVGVPFDPAILDDVKQEVARILKARQPELQGNPAAEMPPEDAPIRSPLMGA